MHGDPCNVCGCKEVNLVDGFYYCIECGTQDQNVRETMVEATMINDGTILRRHVKKLRNTKVEMSPEWHKWHAFNFVLAGMANEVITLGAGPGFKMKLLWIWSRYIKMFQNKDANPEDFQTRKTKDDGAGDFFANSSDSNSENHNEKNFQNYSINTLSLCVLYALIYVALNIDNSDIQVVDIMRFVRERKISSYTCLKYIPNEINTTCISGFKHSKCKEMSKGLFISKAMTVFKKLKIGTPNVPNMKVIVERYIKELCLPEDFKQLVFSLMNAIPWVSVLYTLKKGPTRIPEFEVVAITYIVMGLKICFGLDSDYEVEISDAVAKVNEDNNHSKSYRFDMFSEDTNRLFSFQEWAKYIDFRKSALCQFNIAQAIQCSSKFDDYLLVAQLKNELGEKDESSILVKEHVTMDIIKKLSINNTEYLNYKLEFPATLTPLTTYTNIILSYTEDPDLKLLLSEDFTKYSMKYATTDFNLKINNNSNLIKGVNEINKIQNDYIIWETTTREIYDPTMVYIRDCPNKNWMITNSPKLKHITQETGGDDDGDEDVYCNVDNDQTSIQDSVSIDSIKMLKSEQIKEQTIEDDTSDNIFDDDFLDIIECPNEVDSNEEYDNFEEYNSISNNSNDSKMNNDSEKTTLDMIPPEDLIDEEEPYDPKTFNRSETLKKLVIIACKRYRIPLPTEYRPYVPRKRKEKVNNPEAVETKRRKPRDYDRICERNEIDKLLEDYHTKLWRDTAKEVIEQSIFDQYLSIEDESKIPETDNNISKDELSAIEVTQSNINDDLTNSLLYDQEELDITLDDPNFDENYYDVGQLYIKCAEIESDDTKFDDMELEKLLNRQTTLQDVTIKNEEDTEEFKIKIPKPSKVDSSKLISNKALSNFGYWIRHYDFSMLNRNLQSAGRFNKDLDVHYSKSFQFVLRLCARLCETNAFRIYKQLMLLEDIMMN